MPYLKINHTNLKTHQCQPPYYDIQAESLDVGTQWQCPICDIIWEIKSVDEPNTDRTWIKV